MNILENDEIKGKSITIAPPPILESEILSAIIKLHKENDAAYNMLKTLCAEQYNEIGKLKDAVYYRDSELEKLRYVIEAAKQPRVMKRWAEDCKPEPYTWNWVDLGGTGFGVEFLTPKEIKLGRSGPAIILHWLEFEPTPVLPEKDSE